MSKDPARFEVFDGHSWQPVEWTGLKAGHIVRKEDIDGNWHKPFVVTAPALPGEDRMSVVEALLDHPILTIEEVVPRWVHKATKAFMVRVRSDMAAELERIDHPARAWLATADMAAAELEDPSDPEAPIVVAARIDHPSGSMTECLWTAPTNMSRPERVEVRTLPAKDGS